MGADSHNRTAPDYDAPSARRQVHTTINYFVGEVPVEPVVIGGPQPPKLTKKEPTPVIITDVTGHEDRYKLDVQGFQFVKHKSQYEHELGTYQSRYHGRDPGPDHYYAEMEQLLRDVIANTKGFPKPSSVHILTHIIRRGVEDGKPKGANGTMGPLYGVHVDQSEWAAEGVAHRWLGDKAEELLKKPRYQIINMWRPAYPVTRDPFAVTDARSIPDSDIVKIPLVFPDHEAESLEARPAADPENTPHLWYYKNEQQPDDVLLFMQVDSTKHACRTRRVPHAAFKDPMADESKGMPRVSIETRAMVFYDEDEAFVAPSDPYAA